MNSTPPIRRRNIWWHNSIPEQKICTVIPVICCCSIENELRSWQYSGKSRQQPQIIPVARFHDKLYNVSDTKKAAEE